MSPLTKHSLKVGLLSGIIFGISLQVPEIFEGDSFRIYYFLFSSIFFGLIMGVMNHVMTTHNLEQIGLQNPTESDLKVHQQRVIETELTPEEIKNRLISKGFISERSIKDTLTGFTATLQWTTASWGERFELAELDDREKYLIISRPLYTFVMMDNCKNLKNIIQIEAALK